MVKNALISFCLRITLPKWKIKRDVTIFINFPKKKNILAKQPWVIDDLYSSNTFTLAYARGQALISNTAMYNFYDITGMKLSSCNCQDLWMAYSKTSEENHTTSPAPSLKNCKVWDECHLLHNRFFSSTVLSSYIFGKCVTCIRLLSVWVIL